MRALRIAAIAVCVATVAAASTAPDRLTIVVFDYARTSQRLLDSAVKQGRDVFHAAGVETDWILCSPAQSCYVPDRFVQVRILSHAFKGTPVSHGGMAATTTCSATDHCSTSYVYSDRVEAFSSVVGSPLSVTLAYVMAHEIGHQLGLGHTPGGIMTAGFTSRDLRNAAEGWFTFADRDAQHLRAAVARTHGTTDIARRIKLSPMPGDISE